MLIILFHYITLKFAEKICNILQRKNGKLQINVSNDKILMQLSAIQVCSMSSSTSPSMRVGAPFRRILHAVCSRIALNDWSWTKVLRQPFMMRGAEPSQNRFARSTAFIWSKCSFVSICLKVRNMFQVVESIIPRWWQFDVVFLEQIFQTLLNEELRTPKFVQLGHSNN